MAKILLKSFFIEIPPHIIKPFFKLTRSWRDSNCASPKVFNVQTDIIIKAKGTLMPQNLVYYRIRNIFRHQFSCKTHAQSVWAGFSVTCIYSGFCQVACHYMVYGGSSDWCERALCPQKDICTI